MRANSWIVPIGSFLLAVLLSVISLPSRQSARAAQATTGATPPCAKWELTKNTTQVRNWNIRVVDLPSTMTNSELALGNEVTHTMVKAEIKAHNRLDRTKLYEALPGSYIVVVDTASRLRRPGVHKINLHVQSIPKNRIEAQIKAQFRASQWEVDLLGNPVAPVPPGDVVIDSFKLIDQQLEIKTDGFVYCIPSQRFGEFVPRPVTFAVAGGVGSGTN